MTAIVRYLVVDAPGHYGDKRKVYRVCRTAAAARRWIAGSALFVIARDTSGRPTRRGDTIWRDVPLTTVL